MGPVCAGQGRAHTGAGALRPPRATIDFETRSAVSLRNSGTWKYSIDPSTDILCLAFRLPTWEEGRVALWHPEFKSLGIAEADCYDEILELLNWITSGGLVEAHNAWFEYCIWKNLLTPRYGWPEISGAQWRCSAAKCAAHALPRKLEDAATVLQVDVQKDMEGTKTMKKVSKPRKSRKKERELWLSLGEDEPDVLYHESWDLLERLFIYCKIDVLAEENVSQAIDDLSDDETQVFLLDQRINARGFQLDTNAVDAARSLIASESVLLNAQLREVTRGKVEKATQRDKVKAWLLTEGVDLPDTKKETLDLVVLDPKLGYRARQAITLLRELGRSSTAKYKTMDGWMDPQGVVRGGLLYHGASTGRWSGAGVQPQNFVRGSAKKRGQEKDDKPNDMRLLWECLKREDRDEIEEQYYSVMAALANALRGAIVAREGMQLYVADYSSIEARALLWLAGDDEALGVFRRHEDIYLDMAMSIYKRPLTKADDRERQTGKQAILGLGYQMGWRKFQATCAKFGIIIDDDMAMLVVDAYREKYWRVKAMWAAQEAAAMSAVEDGGVIVEGYMEWEVVDRFLYCRLPSGRQLAYPFPSVRVVETPWGEEKRALTYKGVNPVTRQWHRQKTYGGMIVENQTQAVARDLMAYGMQQCEVSGVYRLILTVHDEQIAEAPLGAGSVKEFEGLMAGIPNWAEGCPVEAEGWTGTRYRK